MSVTDRSFLQTTIGCAILIGVVLASSSIAADRSGITLGLALSFGALFGFVLQRSRFCFLCHTRDLVDHRDPRGVLAILVALAVGAAGYALVMSQWLPVPVAERLPPTAHVGPVSWALAVAGFAFGLGMATSGSCISAHLYRLGEGSPTAVFALLGTLAGFVLGFATWNRLYLDVVSQAPVIWLPHFAGYSGSLYLTFAVLAVLAAAAAAFGRAPRPDSPRAAGLRPLLGAVFVRRWPAAAGGAAVGVLSAAYYLRVAPLGVTAEIGSIARTGAIRFGIAPETLYGLDSFRGCATAVKTMLISENGLFVAGLVLSSLASALIAGQFTPRLPTPGEIARGLFGGILMGWGAMTALGCTVGVLLSGIHAGALSGWVFLVSCLAGVLAGLAMRRFQS